MCQRCFQTLPTTCQPQKLSKTSHASVRREQGVEGAERMSKLFLQQNKVTSIDQIYQCIHSDPATPPDSFMHN